MAKESFVIFKEFYPAIEPMTDLQLGKLFRAIFLFQRDGIENEDPEIRMAFLFFKNQFRLDDIKYEKVVNRNQVNGLKGGRPEKPKEPNLTQPNPENPLGFSEPKKPDNDNDKVNGNEKENENEKVKGKKRKSTSSSATASDGLTEDFLKVYNIFLERTVGTTEQFSVAGRAALSKIIKYLWSQVEKKHQGAGPEKLREETLNGWKYLFAHFDKWDKFHQGQLKLEQINSNIINIIGSIKNPKLNGNHTDRQQQAKQQVGELRDLANQIINASVDQGNTTR